VRRPKSSNKREAGWSFAERGEFAAAYAALSQEINLEPRRALHYMNRGLVLLNLSRPHDAALDFAMYSELDPQSSAGYIKLGLARWVQDKKELADEAWRRALHATHTDEAGGVEAPALLYFSALATNNQSRLDEASGILRTKWRSNMAQLWPGPIVGYLLGKVDEETFLFRQTFSNAEMEVRRECRAYFWAAVLRLSRGDKQNWSLLLQKSAGRPQLLETEYYIALYELGHIPH
jgi:lipoprotein NlpI